MNEQDENRVIVKADIPGSLKLQFKVFCTQSGLTMSEVLEKLIREWIQSNAPTADFISKPLEQDYEEIKGYIPKSIKTQFKVVCTQKQVTICSALYYLITKWVQVEAS